MYEKRESKAVYRKVPKVLCKGFGIMHMEMRGMVGYFLSSTKRMICGGAGCPVVNIEGADILICI